MSIHIEVEARDRYTLAEWLRSVAQRIERGEENGHPVTTLGSQGSFIVTPQTDLTKNPIPIGMRKCSNPICLSRVKEDVEFCSMACLDSVCQPEVDFDC